MSSSAPPIIRSIIAVAAGVFIGGIATVGVEALGHVFVPPPAGLDVTNPEAVRGAMAALPTRHFLPLLLAYVVGPTLGAALAARMAPSRARLHAAVVGGVFAVGGFMNFMSIPHPAWFVVASMLAFLAAPLLGTRIAGR